MVVSRIALVCTRWNADALSALSPLTFTKTTSVDGSWEGSELGFRAPILAMVIIVLDSKTLRISRKLFLDLVAFQKITNTLLQPAI